LCLKHFVTIFLFTPGRVYANNYYIILNIIIANHKSKTQRNNTSKATVVRYFSFLLSFFWGGGDWGLNSGLNICKADTLSLETHLQSILLWLIWRWNLTNSLAGLTLNSSPPDLRLLNCRITGMRYHHLTKVFLYMSVFLTYLFSSHSNKTTRSKITIEFNVTIWKNRNSDSYHMAIPNSPFSTVSTEGLWEKMFENDSVFGCHGLTYKILTTKEAEFRRIVFW
jgi:hypothetical protein